jgi:zona occludens toxin (predicted ATPase)
MKELVSHTTAIDSLRSIASMVHREKRWRWDNLNHCLRLYAIERVSQETLEFAFRKYEEAVIRLDQVYALTVYVDINETDYNTAKASRSEAVSFMRSKAMQTGGAVDTGLFESSLS